MSGHSKWSTIKHKKAKVDAQRGVAFAKYSREIIVAAKLGGGDLASNFRLRTAVEKAKAAGVPNDNIKRAIEKATKGTDGENFFELTYEGYAAGGVAVFIEALTDNKNRTAGDLRSYFTKFNGNLGENGCVGWMFKPFGMIVFDSKDINFDELFETAIEFGAEDIIKEENDCNDDESVIKVLTSVENFQKVAELFENSKFKPSEATLTRICENEVEITDFKTAQQIMRLIDKIEDNDDVQNVYANFVFGDEIEKRLEIEP